MDSKVSEHVIVRWLQYSKRIAIVGLVQWCVIAAIAMAYVGISMLAQIHERKRRQRCQARSRRVFYHRHLYLVRVLSPQRRGQIHSKDKVHHVP